MQFSKTIPIILILISVYVVFLVFSDIGKTFSSIISIDKTYLTIGVSLLLVDMFLRTIRWHVFLRVITNTIPFTRSALYFISGYAFMLSPGRAGEIIRSPFIKRDYGISVSKTASFVLVERFYDLLGVMIIIGIGLVFSNFQKSIIILPLGLIISLLVIIRSKKIFSKVLGRLSKTKFLNKMIPDPEESYGVIFSFMKPKFFAIGTLTSIACSMIEVVSTYLFLLGLGGKINFNDLAVIYNTSNFAGAVSLIPGGIGVMEGGLVGLLVVHKLSYEIALSTAFLVRLFSTGMWSAIGLVCLRIISNKK